MTLVDGDARMVLSAERIEASTAGCPASVPLSLGSDELPRLAEGLRRLADEGNGSFLWTNDGGEVRLEIVMAKRGETHWSLRLQAPPDFLHELRLVFVGRQEDLDDLAKRLPPRPSSRAQSPVWDHGLPLGGG